MTDTEKAYQKKVAERAQALNAELEQSSKFAELRSQFFREALNRRAWWQFWLTPERIFQRAHDCARMDYLLRVTDAQALHERLKEKMRTPQMAYLLGLIEPMPEALKRENAALKLADAVGARTPPDSSPESGLQ